MQGLTKRQFHLGCNKIKFGVRALRKTWQPLREILAQSSRRKDAKHAKEFSFRN